MSSSNTSSDTPNLIERCSKILLSGIKRSIDQALDGRSDKDAQKISILKSNTIMEAFPQLQGVEDAFLLDRFNFIVQEYAKVRMTTRIQEAYEESRAALMASITNFTQDKKEFSSMAEMMAVYSARRNKKRKLGRTDGWPMGSTPKVPDQENPFTIPDYVSRAGIAPKTTTTGSTPQGLLCCNILTCGNPSEELSLASLPEITNESNTYQKEKRAYLEKALNENEKKSTIQLFSRRCGCPTRNGKRDLERFTMPEIEISSRSYFSENLKKSLKDLKFKFKPCLKCFHIGFDQVKEHNIMVQLYYGYAYALECGLSKTQTLKPRVRRLKDPVKLNVIPDTMKWSRAKNNLCDKVKERVYCTSCSYEVLAFGKKKKKSYAHNFSTFNDIPYLQTSYGKKIVTQNALVAMCKPRKSSGNTYTTGEKVLNMYVAENIKYSSSIYNSQPRLCVVDGRSFTNANDPLKKQAALDALLNVGSSSTKT